MFETSSQSQTTNRPIQVSQLVQAKTQGSVKNFVMTHRAEIQPQMDDAKVDDLAGKLGETAGAAAASAFQAAISSENNGQSYVSPDTVINFAAMVPVVTVIAQLFAHYSAPDRWFKIDEVTAALVAAGFIALMLTIVTWPRLLHDRSINVRAIAAVVFAMINTAVLWGAATGINSVIGT